MTQEQIISQLRQIVSTLQRIVTASGELADRVATLESRSNELGPLTAIQGSLSLLLEQVQKQGEEQARFSTVLGEAFEEQQKRIEALEARVAGPDLPESKSH